MKMKKRFVSIIILAVLIISLFPSAAFAKSEQVRAPQPVNFDVYNHSGRALTVLLTNKNTSNRAYLNLGTGVTTESLAQGMYSYTVTTPCGLETGTWNVTPGRVLWITCRYGIPAIGMLKAGSCVELGIYGTDHGFEFWSWIFLKDHFSTLEEALAEFDGSGAYIGCWSSGSGAIYLEP